MITDYYIIVVRVRVTMERRTAVGGESIIMYCTADISVTVSSPSLLVEAGQVRLELRLTGSRSLTDLRTLPTLLTNSLCQAVSPSVSLTQTAGWDLCAEQTGVPRNLTPVR